MALALATALCLTPARLCAQPGSPVPMAFDIPAQPLSAAIEQYMSVTSHSGLYDSALTKGRSSRAVSGLRTPESALRGLVEGSGLLVQYTAPDVFTLTAAPVAARAGEPEPEAPADGRAAYFTQLQGEVQRALCRQFEFTLQAPRFAVSLWIAPSGRVDRVLLLDTSGSPARDGRVTQRLREMKLPPLPAGAGIRQPVTLVVRPDTGGGLCDD